MSNALYTESQPQNPEFRNNPENMDPSSEAQFL